MIVKAMPKLLTFRLLESKEQFLGIQRSTIFTGFGDALDQRFKVFIKVFVDHFLDARFIESLLRTFQNRQTAPNGKVVLPAID